MRQLPVSVVVHMRPRGRAGGVWTTLVIPDGDHVMIVDKLEREENQR